jgi:hypothetical protein
MTDQQDRAPMLMPDPGHGLDRRNLSKKVHDRRVVDNMEDDAGWSASDAVTMEYTTERARSGRRSLRFSTELRNEAYIRAARRENGSFSGDGVLFEQMPFAAIMSRRFSPPQDWSGYNRLSLWCYVHPTDAAIMRTNQLSFGFVCDGAEAGPVDPVALHYVGDLTPGQWNRIIWEFPEIKRDRVSQFRVFQPTSGISVRGAPSRITYDFDELCLELVDAEPVDGWVVTEGKTAYCHVGYQPGAQKIAIAPPGPDDFSLVDAATGETAVTLAAEKVTGRRGTYSVLSFGSFDHPGRYRLVHGGSATGEFVIADDAWDRVVEATLNAFCGFRCGFAIPGVHDACHLDVFAEHDGERRVVGGGWHDAANMTQAPNRTFLSIYALLELHESLLARGAGDLARRALEEARWGIDWLLQTRFGPGLRVLYGDYSYYTDAVPGTIDDVVQDSRGGVGTDPWLNTLSALAGARAARTLRGSNPELSDTLIAAAAQDYDAVVADIAPPAEATPRQINEPSWRDQIGYLTLASVELYRATSEQKYATHAARLARWLVGTQERRFVDGIPVTGYFYEDAGRSRIVHEYHNGFEDSGLLALAALCETLTDHPEWMDWYAGLSIYAEYFCAKGAEASGPFGVIPAAVWRRADIDAPWPDNVIGAPIAAMGPSPNYPTPPTPELIRRQMLDQFEAGTDLGSDHRLRVFPLWYDNTRHGSSNVHLGKTIGLAAAGRVLGRPATTDLAGRQVQWLLGTNPFSRSLMYGVGYDYWQNFTVSLPNLVGGVSLGFNSYRDDSPAWGNNALFPYKELWVFSSCRMAHVLAYVGAPASVTGSASHGAEWRNLRTGAVHAVDPGKFGLRLPGGDYQVNFGGRSRQISLSDGSSRTLDLEPAEALIIGLTAGQPDGTAVTLAMTLSGAGRHELQARTFNARITGLPAVVDLTGSGTRTEQLTVEIEDPSMPWLLAIVPDGRLGDRAEVGGTTRPPQSLA